MFAQDEIALPVLVRPSCPQCGTQMLLVRILPDRPGYEQRTYECPWWRLDAERTRHSDDGETIFSVSVPLGCEVIVSKRLGSPHRSGRSKYRVKVKNQKHQPTRGSGGLAVTANATIFGGKANILRKPLNVRFSNRPVEVKRFQTVHGCGAERRARSTCA
jgi:hypothetical protein